MTICEMCPQEIKGRRPDAKTCSFDCQRARTAAIALARYYTVRRDFVPTGKTCVNPLCKATFYPRPKANAQLYCTKACQRSCKQARYRHDHTWQINSYRRALTKWTGVGERAR